MITFFIMFLIVGAILGVVLDDQNLAIAAIVVLSIGWAFVYGPWAIATFVELLLGFFLARKIAEK